MDFGQNAAAVFSEMMPLCWDHNDESSAADYELTITHKASETNTSIAGSQSDDVPERSTLHASPLGAQTPEYYRDAIVLMCC